jgi:hypothetical protein
LHDLRDLRDCFVVRTQSSLSTMKKSGPSITKGIPIRSAGDLKELLLSTELHDVLSSCLSEVRKVYRMRTMVHADESKERPITALTLEEVPNVFDKEEGSLSEFQNFVSQVESYEAGLPSRESSSDAVSHSVGHGVGHGVGHHGMGHGVLADHFAMKSLEQAFSDLECRLKASHEVIRKLYSSNESLLEENRMLRKELKRTEEDGWKGSQSHTAVGSEHDDKETAGDGTFGEESPSLIAKKYSKTVTIETLIEEIQSMRAHGDDAQTMGGKEERDGTEKKTIPASSGLDEEIRIPRMGKDGQTDTH